MPKYYCLDSLPWLEQNKNVGAIITSLPDRSELGLPTLAYVNWFHYAARLCMRAGNPVIFYQTDYRENGTWISKPEILYEVARESDLYLAFHKIVLRQIPDKVSQLNSVGYSHLLAFGRNCRYGAPRLTPDVIDGTKDRQHKNGMSVRATLLAIRFAKRYAARVVDPFCGTGTVPLLAQLEGLEAVGIDIDEAQIAAAKARAPLLQAA